MAAEFKLLMFVPKGMYNSVFTVCSDCGGGAYPLSPLPLLPVRVAIIYISVLFERAYVHSQEVRPDCLMWWILKIKPVLIGRRWDCELSHCKYSQEGAWGLLIEGDMSK